MNAPHQTNAFIGAYRVVDFIGAGGMGQVYRAIHSGSGRIVALKLLSVPNPTQALNERFCNEARILERLNHPNIALRFDYFDHQGAPCIAMEYVDGLTLFERILAYGMLPHHETFYIFRAIVEGINYVHEQGVVHRDIKSNNVKISETGQVKLLDFGIARMGNQPRLTKPGDVIGTLEYLAPELLKGAEADTRSDIWALGILLYEMVTGKVPFKTDTLADMVEQIGKSSFVKPSVYNPSVPKGLEYIIAKCLRKMPNERYQSCDELLMDLNRYDPVTASGYNDKVDLTCMPGDKSDNFMSVLKPVLIAGFGVLTVIIVFIVIASLLIKPSEPIPVAVSENNAKPPVVKTETGTANAKSDSWQRDLPRHESNGSSMSTVTITIDTWDSGVEVFKNGQSVGKAPAKITAKPGEKIIITLKCAGYRDLTRELVVPNNSKEFKFSLEKD